MITSPMPAIAVVGPSDLTYCFEAAEVLAQTGGENVRAQFFADPGCVKCANCSEYLMREGEVMLCGACGGLTHIDTGNTLTWDHVWLINHRPPKRLRPKPEPYDEALAILDEWDKDKVLERMKGGDMSLEASMQMELTVARAIALDED